MELKALYRTPVGRVNYGICVIFKVINLIEVAEELQGEYQGVNVHHLRR